MSAGRWFAQPFGARMSDPSFTRDLRLVATFDESAGDGGNHIYTAFYGDSVTPGAKSGARYDHHGPLRTIEDALGLGNRGRKDAAATPIQGIWR